MSPNARRVARERGVDVTQLRGTGPGGRVITADVFEAPEQAAVAPAAAGAQRPSVVSPLVRRDAVAAGVDLGSVPAGPGGKIRRADVTAAAARQGAPEPGLPAQVIPLTGMRGVIASRMHASLQEMAQLTLGTDATMDAAVDLRARLKEQWSAAGIAVPTITDLIVRAAALALVEHPRLNASVQEQSIHVQPDINVGMAVALDDGLIVPVVKNADRLPLSGIAAETKRLAAGARTGKLALPDLEGGTFTVSTLGSYGIDFFTPVITPGQVAILGVGRLRDSVRWDGTTPVRTQVLDAQPDLRPPRRGRRAGRRLSSRRRRSTAESAVSAGLIVARCGPRGGTRARTAAQAIPVRSGAASTCPTRSPARARSSSRSAARGCATPTCTSCTSSRKAWRRGDHHS